VNWDGGITLFMVNGQVEPKITIARGEWLRLRLLNADAQGSYILKFDNMTSCEYYLIAADGIFFDEPRDMWSTPYENHIYISMAGRAEVILRCLTAGSYDIWAVPEHSNSTIQEFLNACGVPVYNEQAVMFTVVVNSTVVTNSFNLTDLEFPPKTGYIEDTLDSGVSVTVNPACTNYNTTTFPNITWGIDPDPTQTTQCSSIEFGGELFTGKLFGMNGQYFHHEQELATLRSNKVYEMNIQFFPHPYHHHINPFQLTHGVAYGFLGEQGEWRDVISPSCGGTGTVVARMRTRDYVGKVVMHCHFLPHEDRGLMGYYIISDQNCTSSPPPTLPPMDVNCGQASPSDFCDGYVSTTTTTGGATSTSSETTPAAKGTLRISTFHIPVVLIIMVILCIIW
jgi:FtsP/CotA-like multicopper oxidase with cupredoxin domain